MEWNEKFRVANSPRQNENSKQQNIKESRKWQDQ